MTISWTPNFFLRIDSSGVNPAWRGRNDCRRHGFMIGRTSARIWSGLLLLLALFSWHQVARHWRVETDVLALLPQDTDDARMRTLRHLVTGTSGRGVLVLIGHRDADTAAKATRQFAACLERSACFAGVRWHFDEMEHAVYDFYFPSRYQLLGDDVRGHLKNGDLLYLVRRLRMRLYQPTSMIVSRYLREDPLLLFPDFIQSWDSPVAGLEMHDGLIGGAYQGVHYYLIRARLSMNPFDAAEQESLEGYWREWTGSLRRAFPDVHVLSTSVARFASEVRRGMQRDMRVIGVSSTACIVLLLWGTFGSFKYLLLALLSILSGLWIALGVTIAVFEEIHVMTLAFGASLIGVCVDYCFHYFVHHRIAGQWRPVQTMERIFPALLIGVVTTLAGYLGLFLTPLEGLKQISVFTASGVAVSFATVVFLFPVLLGAAHPHAGSPPLLMRMVERYLAGWRSFPRAVFLLLGPLVLIACMGLGRLRVNDDPRLLNPLPETLREEDRFIRRMIGAADRFCYIAIEGADAEEALQRMEALRRRLKNHPGRLLGHVGPFLSQFLPSRKRQHDDADTLRRLLAARKEISGELLSLGFSDEIVGAMFASIARAPEKLLLLADWLRHEVSGDLRDLIMRAPDGSTVLLLQVHAGQPADVRAIVTLLDPLPWATYIDPAGDFTEVFRQYRRQAVLLVCMAYVVVFCILLWRYQVRGIKMIALPMFTTLVTVGILGMYGHAFHFIHCLALLLILGMGVDYAVFFEEASQTSHTPVFLAITLSAATTEFSFGLLSFSSQEILQAIGLTTFVGMLIMWLLSPCILCWKKA